MPFMRAFELFLQMENVTGADWVRLENELKKHSSHLTFEVAFTGGTIEFYVYGETDFSLLTTKLNGFLLKPVERTPQLNHTKSVSFVLPTHKNILEVREVEQLKKQRTIERILIYPRSFLFLKFYKIEVLLKEREELRRAIYHTTNNPLTTITIDFKKSIRVKKKTPPLFLKMGEDITQLLTSNRREGFLEVFGFPYVSQPLFFPLTSFDLHKHTLIVGQTGVGKSKFIELFVKEIKRRNLEKEYAIVVIDPHASLASHFTSLHANSIDFQHTSCELFPTSANPNIATELTLLLFKTLMGQQFHAKIERVLKYLIYTLLLTNSISLPNLKRFLTELTWRKQILSQLKGDQDHLIHFFETEFAEIQTKFYETAIMPILVLLDELSFIPVFSQTSSPQLESMLNNTFITCLSLNRIFLGEKATRLIAGLVIQQLFLIAQKQSVPKKIILIIDEVSLVENESLIAILSEARKFGLSLVMAQQYLTQISPELLRAILSNIYNYFIFKVSDEDARMLTKNIQMYFSDETVKQEKDKGHTEDDLKRDMLVHLNPRELIARVFSHDRFLSCFKAKTVSM